jgi:hypothetical protein
MKKLFLSLFLILTGLFASSQITNQVVNLSYTDFRHGTVLNFTAPIHLSIDRTFGLASDFDVYDGDYNLLSDHLPYDTTITSNFVLWVFITVVLLLKIWLKL